MAATVSTKNGKKKSAGKSIPALKVADRTLDGLADVFRQLADRTRLKILLVLARDGELNVTTLCKFLQQTQPAVSHHLTLLRMTGLVGYRREGKNNFYRVESGLVHDLLEDFFKGQSGSQRQLPFGDFSLVYKRK